MEMSKKWVMYGLAALGIGGIGSCYGAPHFDRDTYKVEVTDKQVKRYDDSSKYLIFTELEESDETRVFENVDSYLELKFDSSTMYGEVKEGERYKFETYGWRVPFLSWYENISDVEELPDNPDNKN